MRKPIEQELVGLLTPRERIWRAIRKLRTFTPAVLVKSVKPAINAKTARIYLLALQKSGYLTISIPPRHADGRLPEGTYTLVKDAFETPRVGIDGAKVANGVGNLAMWRAMKALKEFDYSDIQRAATVGTCKVAESTARTYLLALARAGYFRTVRESKPGTPARYRLIRDTGAHPPAITRLKVVFDRNTGASTPLQTPQEVCDGIE